MLLAKAIPLVASALVVWKLTKSEVSEQADKFWQMMKLDIPLNKIKVDLRVASPTIVKADLVISNNYSRDIEVSNLVGVVFAKNNNNELVEIARTPPSSKIFTVKKNSKTTISQFPVEVSLFNVTTKLVGALKRPKGDRFVIKFSGFVQNYPITQEIAY